MREGESLLWGDEGSPGTSAAAWDRAAAQRSLDELFQFARQYNSSEEFAALMQFIVRFRLYSPFNAMLAYTQMPGARFVAPAHLWLRDEGGADTGSTLC